MNASNSGNLIEIAEDIETKLNRERKFFGDAPPFVQIFSEAIRDIATFFILLYN